jgi:alpha-beta hydrolase superfamily lysophospholipase
MLGCGPLASVCLTSSLLVLLSAALGDRRPADQEPSVETIDGRFEGTVAAGPESMPLVLEFTPAVGGVSITLDLPAERVLQRPLESVVCEGDGEGVAVTATLPNVDGDFTLRGRAETDGPAPRFVGELTRGSQRAAFELRRTGPRRTLPYSVLSAEFANGAQPLRGELLLPDGAAPRPGVVLVHGSSTPSRHDFRAWADAFARRGIAALIYDKRTLGGPLSGRAHCSLEELADDAAAAAAWLRARPELDPARVALWGFSEGGFTAPLAMARSHASFAALVVVSGPVGSYAETATWQARRRLLDAHVPTAQVDTAVALLDATFAWVRAGGDAATAPALQRQLDDAAHQPWRPLLDLLPERLPDAAERARELRWRALDFDVRDALAAVEVPALFLHGERDARIDGPGASARLRELFRGRSDVEIRLLPGDDHELHRTSDAPQQIADWLARTLAAAGAR